MRNMQSAEAEVMEKLIKSWTELDSAIQMMNAYFGSSKDKRELKQRCRALRGSLMLVHERLREIRKNEHPGWEQLPIHPHASEKLGKLSAVPEMFWARVEKFAQELLSEEMSVARLVRDERERHFRRQKGSGVLSNARTPPKEGFGPSRETIAERARQMRIRAGIE